MTARCPGGDRACAPVLSQRRWASDSTLSGPPASTASSVDGGVPSAAASGDALAADAGTLADRVFEHDVHFSAKDIVPASMKRTDRFPDGAFTVYATPQRREMARSVLAECGLLLTGAQGFGKSFFAAGLVYELRRLEPRVPVMYLPYADFTPAEAAEALRFALEKAEGCPPVPALDGPVPDLNVVVMAMQTVTLVHKKPLRLVIDQMNTAFRSTPPNDNYKSLIGCAPWFLLVTSHTTTTVKLKFDMPTIDYGVLPFDETIGCAMINRVLPERLHGSAPRLYKRTGGNPLELGELVAYVGKQECKTDAQLEAAAKSWFGARVTAVYKKLTADGPSHMRDIILGWLKRNGLADPRYFANGEALFPAVEAAMRNLLQAHPECVPVDLEEQTEAYGKVYESRVQIYLARKDIFGWYKSKPTMKTFVCNTVPADFADTIKSAPETSQLIIWWPDEDKLFNQSYFDFVYTLYSTDGNGAGTWYMAFVQCCGCVHRDTHSSFLKSSLWEEWRTALNGLRTVEYMWLSHTQPEDRPKISAPQGEGRPYHTVFPPANSNFEKVQRVTESDSVLASSKLASNRDRWVYVRSRAGASSDFPIPTVSLMRLRMATIEQPPPSTDEQATAERVFVRAYGLPGVPTGAVIDVGTTLKQGGLPLIVDGLKEAVLKKLANSLVGTGIIAHLMVYPPGPERGTEPYTAMSTQLAAAPEESPYHVVLPPMPMPSHSIVNSQRAETTIAAAKAEVARQADRHETRAFVTDTGARMFSQSVKTSAAALNQTADAQQNALDTLADQLRQAASQNALTQNEVEGLRRQVTRLAAETTDPAAIEEAERKAKRADDGVRQLENTVGKLQDKLANTVTQEEMRGFMQEIKQSIRQLQAAVEDHRGDIDGLRRALEARSQRSTPKERRDTAPPAGGPMRQPAFEQCPDVEVVEPPRDRREWPATGFGRGGGRSAAPRRHADPEGAAEPIQRTAHFEGHYSSAPAPTTRAGNGPDGSP